jgi:hypothetical protein
MFIGLLHGIRADSLNDDRHFSPDVEHMFGQKVVTREEEY